MTKYVARRLIFMVPVLLGVTLGTFVLLHLLPVDPVQFMLTSSTSGTSPSIEVTAETAKNLRHELGLDRPLIVQYVTFVADAAQGNLGESFRNNRPVTDLILEQFPFTAQLTVAGGACSIVLGLLLGIVAALRPRSLVDRAAMVIATLGVAIPAFWLGLILIYIFALQLRLLPAIGWGSDAALVLPALTLGLPGAAIIARLTRTNLVEALQQDYVITARSKGIGERRILLRHAFRNAMLPVVTVIGLQIGDLLTGTVVVETVFGRPGVGRLGVQAILQSDFPLVQGFVLVVATVYVLSNLGVDLIYAWLDPRVRVG